MHQVPGDHARRGDGRHEQQRQEEGEEDLFLRGEKCFRMFFLICFVVGSRTMENNKLGKTVNGLLFNTGQIKSNCFRSGIQSVTL